MRLNDLTARLFNDAPWPGRVLFRVDAGRKPGLSFGHLERCHMLAQGLRSAWRPGIKFLMNDFPDGTGRAKSLGEDVALFHPNALNQMAGQFDAVVFDLPAGPSEHDLTLVRQAGLWTIVMDDTNRSFSWASVILNSSILARRDTYPPSARLLLGPEYLILPDGFDDPHDRTGPGSDKTVVLITFGGSDPAGLTVRALSAIVKHPWNQVTFKVVAGPGFKEADAVAELAKKAVSSVEVVTNPPDLWPLMKQADLAVCAGGRTLYELNALSVPIIALAGIGHEVDQVRAFRDRGLVLAGFDAFEETAFMEALHQSLQHVINNRDSSPNPNQAGS